MIWWRICFACLGSAWESGLPCLAHESVPRSPRNVLREGARVVECWCSGQCSDPPPLMSPQCLTPTCPLDEMVTACSPRPSHCTFHSPIRIRYGAVHPTFWLSRLSACPLPSCPCLACLSFPSSRMTSVQALVCYIYSAPSARLSAASRSTTQRTPHPCYPTLDAASTEPKTHPPLLSPVLCCHCRSWPLDPSPGIGLSSLGITINQ